MTLAELLNSCTEKLHLANLDNAQREARILITRTLGIDRLKLLIESETEIAQADYEKLEKNLARRMRGEPIGRIFGEREFWSLPFKLNQDTLEPRADSEILIETTLKQWDKKTNPAPRILDLGTGTGCLLLALLHEYSESSGLGIDKSIGAIAGAQENAENLGLDKRAHFQTGAWHEGISKKFDIIISNPPYIKSADIADLMVEVRDYDPPLALDGGHDGITPYREIIPNLPNLLNPGGMIIFEVGQGQADDVMTMLKEHGFQSPHTAKDIQGIERCVWARIL